MGESAYYKQPQSGVNFGQRVEYIAFYGGFVISFILALLFVGSNEILGDLTLLLAMAFTVIVSLRFRLIGFLGLFALQLSILGAFSLSGIGCFGASKFEYPALLFFGFLSIFSSVSFLVAVVIGYKMQTSQYRQNLLQKVFEVLPIGISVRARPGEIVYVNKQWASFSPIYGFGDVAATGKERQQWEHVEALITKSHEDYQVGSQAVQIEDREGRKLTMTLLTMPMHIDHYDEDGMLVLLVDETVLRSYEDKVRTTEQSLSLALDNAEMGFWDHNLVTDEVLHNSNWLRILDLTPEELEAPYEAWRARLHPEDQVRVESAYGQYAETGIGTLQLDYRIRSGPSAYIWVQDYVGVVERDEHGSVCRIMGTMQDITPRKKIESDLKLEKERAETASEAKGQFLSTISHEIRTPLNAIIGLSSFLLDSELSEDQEDLVDTIRSSGRSLLTLVNDILDYSKIEARNVSLEVQEYPLHLCFDDCLKLFKVQAQAKNIELSLSLESNLPEYALGDFGRLRQVVQNLLSNALKFTEFGKISVTVSCVKIDQLPYERQPDFLAQVGYLDEFDNEYLQVVIKDSGIGIPEDRQHVLFEAFSQVDASTTRKYGGTGLGLAICKRLVTAMGGKIWLESREGEGALFGFVVRTQLISDFNKSDVAASGASIASKRVESVAQQYPCHILVVGSKAEVCGVLNACRNLGYFPHHAAEYDLRAASYQRRRYHLVLISMGDVAQALTLARELSMPSNLHASCSLFGCVPRGMSFSADRAKLSGMAGLIESADQPEVLKATILELIGARD
jgi:signal transduction histidine kinase